MTLHIYNANDNAVGSKEKNGMGHVLVYYFIHLWAGTTFGCVLQCYFY